jgi:hypothetical protein
MNTSVEVLPRRLYNHFAKHDPILKLAFDEMKARGLIDIEPDNEKGMVESAR